MSQSRTHLTLELLETRETPGILSPETFDTVTPPALPSGWTTWSSDGSTSFATAAGKGVNGTDALVSNGTSKTSALATYPQAVSGDTGAAVSMDVNSLVPMYVFARGSNLNDPSSKSYLAVVVTRGMDVELVEVKGLVTRVLGNVTSTNYVSGDWIQVSLSPTGSTVKVEVSREDTGQYLNSSGTWQTAETAVITATTSLPSVQGNVGVGRNAIYSGAVSFDNFSVIDSTSVPPVVPPPPPPPPPPITGAIAQTFDTTAAGRVPTGWSEWSSASIGPFATESTLALSLSNGFASNGNSNTASRAWANSTLPADEDADVAIYLNSLIPAQLMVRGTNLQGTTPTYYAVEITRGLQASLVKVVNGVQTTLATIKSTAYFSSQWARVRLLAEGNDLQVQIYNPVTQQWLTSSGSWSATQSSAIEVHDSSITGGGYAGIGRRAAYAGVLTMDDFTVTPVSPQVTIAQQGGTGTVTGKVTFTATATDNVNQIQFLLNGVVQSTSTASPASWTFDSTTVANGTYTLTVQATNSSGATGSQTLTLTVSNASKIPPTPTIPLHNSNIGIAELAYNGTPVSNSFEQGLLQNDVDLVVSYPTYLSAINATSPNTPQLIYNNVSNLYGSLLASWLSYASANNVNPESAFYHVTQATPFSGSSGSSQPVNWFWGVYQSNSVGALTDETSAAHGGGASVLQLGGAGTSTSIGYIEPFNQINITLAQAPGAGWAGQWEYVAAVDANGNPTLWKPLSIYQNSTGNLTTTGQIMFNVPTDWVPAILTPGGYSLYYVRLVATQGTAAQAPQFLNILGDDYVDAMPSGGTSGVIPAFDYAAADGKDYLTPAEYANRAPGDNAWFAYQSRLFYPFYGQMRFVTNPSSTAVQDWAASYNEQLLEANPLAAGVFLDNSTGNLPFPGISVLESTATYSQDSGALVGAIARAIAPKWVMVNTSGGPNTADSIVANASADYEESLLRPMTATWASVGDAAALVARRLNSPSNPDVVMDSSAVGGSPTDPRTELATLAYYDLLAIPGRTFLDFYGGDSPSSTWMQHWSAAAKVNIGTPTGTMQVYATGQDPENKSLTYKVYSRQYSNGLVLYKPLSYATGVGTGTTDNATATTVQLNGSYRVVNADGTLGAAVTSVTLRNGEGAVLVKA